MPLLSPEAGEWYGMADLLPSGLIYAAVFALICSAWVVHHDVLSRVEHINRKMLWANFGFLFLMSMKMPLETILSDPREDVVALHQRTLSVLVAASRRFGCAVSAPPKTIASSSFECYFTVLP